MVGSIGRGPGRSSRDRGQLLVFGAVALAVIAIGFVAAAGTVGVASSPASPDAGEEAVVEAKLERGIGCLLERASDRSASTAPHSLERVVEAELDVFADDYRTVRTGATSTEIGLELEDVSITRRDDTYAVENATVRATIEAPNRRSERTRTIEAACPEGEP
ncbi:hypothetical protein [Natronococcus jeotgali]|uniref:Uncharacterized protein n=1 Tax=Natronococcus jeotgali DSM 18795 TaxID=1227498 RepID=L9WTU1_9EURY|nr:hypothetical protein [Natronococcus jeotgali]ELY52870.1 hypothetical protein C492_18845 [Natronococcus jeotgali DSM 18795]